MGGTAVTGMVKLRLHRPKSSSALPNSSGWGSKPFVTAAARSKRGAKRASNNKLATEDALGVFATRPHGRRSHHHTPQESRCVAKDKKWGQQQLCDRMCYFKTQCDRESSKQA